MKMSKKPTADLTIDDLRPADWNPRVISPEAFAGLKGSLKEFGDISGIVFNRRMGIFLCGHQRWQALKDEYGDKLQIIQKKDDKGVIMSITIRTPDGKIFGVRIVDWDDATSIAANLAANSQLISGEFTDKTGELVDRVAKEIPLLARTTRVDELFLPEVKRPATGDLVDKEKLEGEEQPELLKLDKNYLYVANYGESERHARLVERLKAAGVLRPPHEINRDWFEDLVFKTLPRSITGGKKLSPRKKATNEKPPQVLR